MGIVPLCTDVCCVSSVVVRLAGLVGYVVWCASHLIMQADSIQNDDGTCHNNIVFSKQATNMDVA